MAEARRQRSKSGILWLAAGIALVFIFFGVRGMTREKLPLRVAESQIEDLVKSTSTNGKVEPQMNFAAHAPTAGVIREVYVHSGELVPQGKLLLSVDDTDAKARLAAAAAALRAAEAGLEATQNGGTQQQRLALSANLSSAEINRQQAAHDLALLQKLLAQGAASPNEVAQAQARLKVAQDSVASLERQRAEPFAPVDLTRAKSAVAEAQAAYAAAAEVIAQSNVRAPFRGTVYSLPVARYEYVEPGSDLLQLADLSRLQVRAYFDEPEIGDLQLGDPVAIVWAAKPGLVLHGRIVRLPSTVINYGTRNVGEVLVSIDNPYGILLPNTNVTVTVTMQQVHNALTVPREALYVENGRDYVYVVAGDTLRRQAVQVGTLNLVSVQILSGLREHTTVALGTTNGAPISAGAPIRIVN